MAEFEPLFTELDAAKFLNTHPGTLRNWRSKGGGPPFVKVGNAVRYCPQSLREYIAVHTRNAAAADRGVTA